jgi:proteasome lid subunit RPN8/RPN11
LSISQAGPPPVALRPNGEIQMTSVDEPIFEEEETGEGDGAFDLPARSLYIGTVAEAAIPEEMPTLYLDLQVAKQLQAEGQRSIKTDKEVAGILLGTKSPDNQAIKISHIAIAVDEDSSPVHFKFTYSVWDDLIDQMERMSREAGEELLLLGWYHTHPNMSVFLSRYDLRTHRDFHRPYQFALVLAPRRGTRDTSMGFFCNRGGETPLVPGVRVFGTDQRKEVTGALPWRFQIIEAEGIEEGETLPAGASEPVDDTPALYQLGVVRMEDADWLRLGVDKVEGPALSILEGMAGAVVETHQDRLGVLLGTIDPNNHVTITRVRFLGHLGVDPSRERVELVGALRFMAQTFPASGEQKIVGVVRIVSPHQFKAGDTYDPTANNIRIAQMLGEVGYDLDLVPFQVGLVLYPGIEEEVLFFQVFAQHKSSRPVPLMSLQAMAPRSLRANERYEPVGEAVFIVESDPCMLPPGYVPPSTIGVGSSAPRLGSMLDTMDDDEEPTKINQVTGSGIDWDSLPDEDDEEDVVPQRKSLVPVVLLLSGLAAVVILLLLLNLLARRQEGAETGPTTGPGTDAELVELGAPYTYALVGCGGGWNPGIACEPFADRPARTATVDLVRVEKRDAYLQATIQPIDAWLLVEGGSRHRLDRRSEGDDIYVFSVGRTGDGWDTLWGDGAEVRTRLVILPRGAELELEDELTWLRRVEQLKLKGPAPDEESDDPGEPGLRPDQGATVAGEWAWKSGAAAEQTSYDARKKAFESPLVLVGGTDTAGEWTFSYRTEPRGAVLASMSVVDPSESRGGVDVAKVLTRLMRDPAVVQSLQAKLGEEGAEVHAGVRPPGASQDLAVRIALVGEVTDSGVQHKVCVMLRAVDGLDLPDGKVALNGRARIGESGQMLPTRDPSANDGRGECADGGRTGRWRDAAFGPETTLLQFIYEGSEESLQLNRDKIQKAHLPERWSSSAPKCLAITVYLGPNGYMAQAARVEALYDLVSGACQ